MVVLLGKYRLLPRLDQCAKPIGIGRLHKSTPVGIMRRLGVSKAFRLNQRMLLSVLAEPYTRGALKENFHSFFRLGTKIRLKALSLKATLKQWT